MHLRFPKISNIQITVINENCEGIPIVIAPGFLTENSNEWLDFLSKCINTPIIYVKWRSSSILGITKEVLYSALYSFIPLRVPFRLSSVLGSVYKVYDAWSEAAKEANLAGKDLANFLNDIWDDEDKGIFIGHSLGVRVITEAMTHLKYDNVFSSISIAGAIDVDEYEKRIMRIESNNQIQHINIFSNNDAVLKYLYIPAEFSLSPLGLKESCLPCVDNILTNIGHTEYQDSEAFAKMISDIYHMC